LEHGVRSSNTSVDQDHRAKYQQLEFITKVCMLKHGIKIVLTRKS